MKTRRLLALALSFVMALACLPTAAVTVDRVNAEEGSRVQNTGDLQLDFDGSELDGYCALNADVNGDGAIDFTDVAILVDMLLTM